MIKADMLLKKTHEEINREAAGREALPGLPRHPIYVVCENIRSLYNVGSIFRTSDGIRAAKVFLCGYTGHPPRKEIDKVALGAVDSVPWEYRSDTRTVITELQQAGVEVLALEHTHQSITIQDYDCRFPVALVVGHECDGVTQDVVGSCDAAVEIPMYGIKQSLNVATAYGVAAYIILDKFLRKPKSLY